MKTLQVTGDSPYGGAGYLLLRWCRHLLQNGWQVDILASNPYWAGELRKIPGLKVIEDILIPRGISPLKDLAALARMVALIRRERYDVVHTYTATPGFVGRLAARIAGAPVILHHQAGWTVTDFSPAWQRMIYGPLETLATAASTRDICVSHAVEQQGRALRIAPPSKMVVICNGIDPQPFIDAVKSGAGEAFRRQAGIAPDCLLIGNTGRLAPQKDHPSLIEGMARLRDLLPDLPFTLMLAGDGPDLPALEALAAAHSLENRVRMPGFLENIPAFLAAVDIFISPSLWEGLSISLLEAMAAARPIITTSILPNAELIEHEKTGLLVAPRRPEQIASAAARFIKDPALARACGSAARQRVMEKYTIGRMFQETLDLYLDLFQQAGPQRLSLARGDR